jgi:hypothetical protein
MTDLFLDVIPHVNLYFVNFFRITISRSVSWLISSSILQTIESSPPRKSNSGKDIEYAPGLIPNGGGLAPPVISYNAPRTSSLLKGK